MADSNTYNNKIALRVWLNLPAFTSCIAFCGGIVLSVLWNEPRMTLLHSTITIPAIMFLIVIAVSCKNTTLRILLFFLAGFILCSYHTGVGSLRYITLERIAEAGRDTRCTGLIVKRPVAIGNRYSFEITASDISTPGFKTGFPNHKIRCISKKKPPQKGGITAIGQLSPLKIPHNVGQMDSYSAWLSGEIAGTMYVDSIRIQKENEPLPIIYRMNRNVEMIMDKALASVDNAKIRGLMIASMVGDVRMLDQRLSNDFKQSGIYHLLALSGFNVALLVGSLMALLTLIPVSKTVKILIAICVIWYYQLLAGYIPSLFRASVMATLFLGATLVQRNSHPLNSLGVAAIFWLLISPYSLFSPGFQLSFTATLGILCIAPYLTRNSQFAGFSKPIAIIFRYIFQTTAITSATFLFTLPVLLYHFGTLSLTGFVTNMVAIGIMSIGMYLFFAGILLQPISVFLCHQIMFCSGKSFGLLAWIASVGSNWQSLSWKISIPWPSLFILYYAILLSIFGVAFKKRKLLFVLMPALTLLAIAAPLCGHRFFTSKSTELRCFDLVESSILGIRLPGDSSIIFGSLSGDYSAKEYQESIFPWFIKNGITSINYLIIDQYNADMAHDIIAISNRLPIRNIMVPADSSEDGEAGSLFKLFAQSSSIPYTVVSDSLCFMPTPSCTCTVFASFSASSQRKQTLCMSYRLNGLVVNINTSMLSAKRDLASSSSSIIAERLYTKTRNDNGNHPVWSITISGTADSTSTMRTDRDGSIGIFIARNGKMQTQTMRDQIYQRYWLPDIPSD